MIASLSLLDQICRNPGQFFDTERLSSSDPRFKVPGDILELVLSTATSSEISNVHQAQACSATCAFLEHSLKHGQSDPKYHLNRTDTIQRLLSIILDSSENLRPKTIRQVFVVLNSLLSWLSTQGAPSDLSTEVSGRILSIICGHDSHSKVKPAFQALEYLVKRGTLNLFHFLGNLSSRSDCQKVEARLPIPHSNDHLKMNYGELLDELANIILEWIIHPDVAPAAANAFCTIATNGVRDSADPKGSWWQAPLVRVLHRYPDHLEAFRNQLFPGLFKPNFRDMLSFLDILKLRSFTEGEAYAMAERDLLFLFSALEAAKEIGFLVISNAVATTTTVIAMDEALLSSLTTHHSSSIRHSALSLLISNPSTTEEISVSVKNIILNSLPHFLNESDAKARNDFLSLVLALTRRIYGSATKINNRLMRLQSKVTPDEIEIRNCYEQLEQQEKFLRSYVGIFRFNLQPNASYQAMITSLRAITILAQIGIDPKSESFRRPQCTKSAMNWPIQFNILTRPVARCLGDLLLNPYEDVRMLARDLLEPELCRRKNLQSRSIEEVSTLPLWQNSTLLTEGERSVERSGRSDHADGLAKVYLLEYNRFRPTGNLNPRSHESSVSESLTEHILNRLESKVDFANRDITQAVSSKPMHGELGGLRAIFDSTKHGICPELLDSRFRKRTIQCCIGIWNFCQSTLCHDSPEGLEVVDIDGAEDENDVGTKELLSFSWRALRESSLLLRSIVVTVSKPSLIPSVDSLSDLLQISHLNFQQLKSLRHRGAFTTVSSTFQTCCKLLANSKSLETKDTLKTFYQETLRCIDEQSGSVTRRSAGIPRLIVGIVSADTNDHLLKSAFHDLEAKARLPYKPKSVNTPRLPQVHALNCLRAILDTPNLVTSKYLPSSLRVASHCLNSESWAIRNGALMLFRALIDRLLGTAAPRQKPGQTRLHNSTKISFTKYPELLDVILELLGFPVRPEMNTLEIENARDGGIEEGVMLALEILEESGVPADDFVDVIAAVRCHFGSPLWHVRVLASRAYAALSDARSLLLDASTLLGTPWVSQNELHGILLTCARLYHRYLTSIEGENVSSALVEITSQVLDRAKPLFYDNPCPFTRAALLDILDEALLIGLKHTSTVGLSLQKALQSLDLTGNNERQDEAIRLENQRDFLLLMRSKLRMMCLRGWINSNQDGFRSAVEYAKDFRDLEHLAYVLWYLSSVAKEELESETKRFGPEFWTEGLVVISELANSSSECLPACAYCIRYITALPAGFQGAFRLVEPKKSPSPLACFSYEQTVSPDMVRTTPASFQRNILSFQGLVLTLEFLTERLDREACRKNLRRWAAIVYDARDEKNSFDLRLAAVQSLSSGIEILKLSEPLGAIFDLSDLLPLYLTLHDLSNDDDIEIRDEAALITAHVTKPAEEQHSHIEMPSAAILKLSAFLSRHFSDNMDLRMHALSRLTNATPDLLQMISGTALFAKSEIAFDNPSLMLKEIRKPNFDLFAEEKQNLYINTVQECSIWAQLLKRMSGSTEDSYYKNLEIWVTLGLQELRRISELKDIKQGFLGWTSAPEVFAFGLRVIYAAGVLLCWQKWTGGAEKGPLNNLLMRVEVKADTGCAHPMWAAESRRIRYEQNK